MEQSNSYRLIWFQHLHKCAGTYIIKQATLNGEKFWHSHKNGNPLENQNNIKLWEMTPSKLTSFIDRCQEQGVTFIACEWGAPEYQTLAGDDRVTLVTCIRNPINRYISNYNYDYYRMWTKSNSYEEYLTEDRLHSSPEYYIKIFARGELDFEIALSNAKLFDIFMIAEDGMNKLDQLGWNYKNNKIHSTFGNPRRAINLLIKLKLIRLYNYIRKYKYMPNKFLKIEELNNLDTKLYNHMRKLAAN
jgi:hypothetical protein